MFAIISEIFYFGFILIGLICIIQGIVLKKWYGCVCGVGIVIWTILYFRKSRLEVKGYIAVYSNKIVEKKKQSYEVFFKDYTPRSICSALFNKRQCIREKRHPLRNRFSL
jgi:hypothetical protein